MAKKRDRTRRRLLDQRRRSSKPLAMPSKAQVEREVERIRKQQDPNADRHVFPPPAA